jgi:hypothetical protein
VIVLQVAAVPVLLGSLLALIQILKLSFQFPSAPATVGRLVVAVCLAVAVFAIFQIYLFRARSEGRHCHQHAQDGQARGPFFFMIRGLLGERILREGGEHGVSHMQG